MIPSEVPNDIWVVIFGSLAVNDLGRVARVCKLFNLLSEDDIIWRVKYQEVFSARHSIEATRSADENRGWKIRFRFAFNNLPLHNILFGSSFIHKLCVHPFQGSMYCITDRFWRSVYHHGIAYSHMLDGVHSALHSSFATYSFNSLIPFSIYLRKLKCLMVGDAGVGKRTLLASLAAMDYTTGTANKFQVNVMVHKRILSYEVDILSEMDQLDTVSNLNYDLIMLCFSTTDRQSFKNIPTWNDLCKSKLRQTPAVYTPLPQQPHQKEIAEHKVLWKELSTKTVLVGTHLDVAMEKGVNQQLLVSFRDADRLATSLQANLYAECSSKKLTGLAALFVSVSGLFTPLEGYDMEVTKSAVPLATPYRAQRKDSCVVM